MILESKEKWIRQLHKVAESRANKNKKELLLAAEKRELNIDLTICVVNFIIDYLPTMDIFIVDLEDDLINDYWIDQEDLGDFYSSILKKYKVRKPSRKSQLDFFGNESTYSVELAIKFLEWCINSSK